jgi:hypothetical protein
VREDEAVAQKQERQSLLSLSHLLGSFPFVLLACSCPRGQQGRSFRQSASHLSLFGVFGLCFPPSRRFPADSSNGVVYSTYVQKQKISQPIELNHKHLCQSNIDGYERNPRPFLVKFCI